MATFIVMIEKNIATSIMMPIATLKKENILIKKIFPILGFALIETDDAYLKKTEKILKNTEGVKHIKLDEEYELIRSVEETPIDTLGIIPEWHLNMIGIPSLKEKGLTGKNIDIGFLDSGCASPEDEFSNRISTFIAVDKQCSILSIPPRDILGHGTQVCSIAAGATVGIAPSATLHVASIAEDGRTSFSQMVAGLEWLIQQVPNIRLINMSVGKIEDPTPELELLVKRVRELGILLVCAIGNDGEGITRTPADISGVLSVGAVNITQAVPSFSGGKFVNRGGSSYVKPDVVMPGEAIPVRKADGKLSLNSGTSFAAPMLTGLAALLLEENPSLTVDELEKLLIQHCQDLPAPPQRDGNGLPVF